MKKRTTRTRLPSPASPAFVLDPDTAQNVVHRRLAMRFGLSLPVAAAMAALAGLGPQGGRRG